MRKVLIVTGTRPEIVKMAPVHDALQRSGWCWPLWCHTGQHDGMARQMFEFFGISPNWTMERDAGDSLADLAAGILHHLDARVGAEPPDQILVHGDTTTTFAAAFVAFSRRIPVAHVEAGLRTHCRELPFPEEINRQLTAVLASRHYAPTQRARENLIREGVEDARIHVTGNTVVDAQGYVRRRYGIQRARPSHPVLLVTAHRRENWDSLDAVCEAINQLVDGNAELEVVFPVHLNPLVRERVARGIRPNPRVRLCEPLDYVALQRQLAGCSVVLTDSGGIQEEAAGYGVPCFVMRDVTERPEAVEAGIAWLVGTRIEHIVAGVAPALRPEFRMPTLSCNPFGDGHAAQRIVEDLHAQRPH